MMRARWLLAAMIAVPFVAACDNGPLPTVTTPEVPAVTSPVTESFTSLLNVGGYAYRSITAVKAGTITITLSSVPSSSTVKLGFGLGIPDANGTACLYTKSVETAVGGQLSAPVDAGGYCLRVWDLGTLTAPTNFTVTIVRP